MTGFDTEVVGRAWDAPTAAYTVEQPESLIAVEITGMGGRLRTPHIVISISCRRDGTKVLIDATRARGIADYLNALADRLDAGATSAEVN